MEVNFRAQRVEFNFRNSFFLVYSDQQLSVILSVLYYILYYIRTRFIDKFNAFWHFYRKNQCVSLFETKTKVFSKNTYQILPTPCRV